MSHEIHGTSNIGLPDIPVSKALKREKVVFNHSTVPIAGKATYKGYRNIPVSHLKCTEDLCAAPKLQQSINDTIINDFGTKLDVHEILSGPCLNVKILKTLDQVISIVAGKDV